MSYRIGIVKPSALGDIVHALPVLTALRRRFPAAHLTWVVNSAYEPLLRGHPDLDATLAFDRGAGKRGLLAGLGAWGRLVAALRRARFDLILDLQGLFRSGLMCLLSGARRRIGLAGAREGGNWFHTEIVPAPGREAAHAVDRYWHAARHLGAGDGPLEFRLPPFSDEQPWCDGVLERMPRPWLAVAVGSRWQTKRWPPEHFGELLRRARATFGGSVIFVGSPEDIPPSLAAGQRLSGPTLQLAGKTTLPQLAVLLSRADAVVANDTGPLHLAAALGRPVVAPYTCTRAALTGPYRSPGVVETNVHCAGSLLKTCPRMECMAELTPDRLWPPLAEVLERWQATSRTA